MIGAYFEKAQQWLNDTVRSSAIREISRSIEGKSLKKALPPILTYIVAAAVLISQLLLVQWPQSFAAFLLLSPIIANAILSALAIACRPSIASSVPLYACIGVATLAALQCIMGAFAMVLPGQPNRTIFSLLSAALVLCLCMGISKSFVKSSMQQITDIGKKPNPNPNPEPSETSEEYEDA